MLTQTAGQPLYGKISDLIGRKVGKLKRTARVVFKLLLQVVLYTSMFVFCIGSLLSGTSKASPRCLVPDYLSYARSVHHMADLVQSAQWCGGWRDRRLCVDDYVRNRPGS